MAEITKIAIQKKNKDRYSIFIDGEYSFGVYENVLIKHGLRKGMQIDEDFIEDVLKKEEQECANNYGLRLLSFKMRTEQEIRRRMREKEYTDEIIDTTIDYLYYLNYLDDEEYAQKFIKDKSNLKNMGSERIKRELYMKGIDKNIIDRELEEIVDKDDEYEKAKEIAIKKLETTYKNDDKNARYRKLGGLLQRRGYSMDIVMPILKELL